MTVSSYKNNIDYKEIFSTICFLNNPKKIVEIGILDGYSLKSMAHHVAKDTEIEAYDIFDEFNGNSANENKLNSIFETYNNVNIKYGNFYFLADTFDIDSIDILHIDIANNGQVYEYVLNNYTDKLKKNGIIILEGGSVERDDIDWMNKYNKPKIRPVLDKFKSKYNILTMGDIPSITLVTKK